MTAREVLVACRQAGIVLAVDGGFITVDGPETAVTPEIIDQLSLHKPTILASLAPVTDFVPLKGGLVVPTPALLLALELERRGFRMSLDRDQQFHIEPSPALSEADLIGIQRWRLHLGAIVGYEADAQERTQ